MSNRENITRIKAVHEALGYLAKEVVFVGGATVSLYADRETGELRPTDDVDILVELWTKARYATMEAQLRALGFQHDQQSGIICRFTIRGIVVDVMPVDPTVLGFANQWYEEGFKQSVDCRLDSAHTVRIFSTPYFIASKLEAFKHRGRGDGRASHDFEDLVFVWNNRSTVWKELDGALPSVKTYLQHEISNLLDVPYFEEWITAHLDFNEEKRAGNILEGLRNFASNLEM